jgi:hypothetical protein
MPDSVSPLRSPEFLAPIVQQPLIEGPNPYRLCSSDHECGGGDAGCRRTDTLLTFEAENNVYVTGQEYWGPNDVFFVFDGKLYYEKKYINGLLAKRNADPQFLENLSATVDPNILTYNSRCKDVSELSTIIANKNNGMPTFIKETENFFIFEDPGLNDDALVTIDKIDRAMLDRIVNTFTGPNFPNKFVFDKYLYEVDGKLYFADLSHWKPCTEISDEFFFGLFVNQETPTEKYPNAATECYFFPFNPNNLTADQQKRIEIGADFFASDINKKLVVVSL